MKAAPGKQRSERRPFAVISARPVLFQEAPDFLEVLAVLGGLAQEPAMPGGLLDMQVGGYARGGQRQALVACPQDQGGREVPAGRGAPDYDLPGLTLGQQCPGTRPGSRPAGRGRGSQAASGSPLPKSAPGRPRQAADSFVTSWAAGRRSLRAIGCLAASQRAQPGEPSNRDKARRTGKRSPLTRVARGCRRSWSGGTRRVPPCPLPVPGRFACSRRTGCRATARSCR